MAEARSDLLNFIIDLDDDECPDVSLHVAAFQGKVETLQIQLEAPRSKDMINSRVRPFLATPLRLAATAGHLECLKMLLAAGANIDCLDAKAQTPLFVSLVNQQWACARLLLESGADPNGSSANLCSPLSIMCQRGFYPGVKLLCEFGADTEDIMRILSGMPGLPITSCATYHHLRCFALLLLHGAAPDLSRYRGMDIPPYVYSQCSVAHAIIKYRCPAEFLYLYREFGGNLWIRDGRGQLACDLADSAPALEYFKQYLDSPLSLQSQCRLTVRRAMGGGGLAARVDQDQKQTNWKILELGLTQKINDILTYRYVDPAAFDPDDRSQVTMYKTLVTVMNEVVEDVENNYQPHSLAFKWQNQLSEKLQEYLSVDSDIPPPPAPENTVTNPPIQVSGAPPPPPPPPMAPTPPKPKLLRFPGAEGMKKKHFSGYR